MNLSKSKYCNLVQCKKILWLDKYMPDVKEEVDNDSVLNNGTEVGIIARNLFKGYINVPFDEKLTDMLKTTSNLIQFEKIVVTEASFLYDNNFCSVDILKKDKDSFEIYEVKSSTELKDIYLDDVAYQYYVLKNLGLKVDKCFLVHINSSYVRKGELELDKLFIKEDVTEYALEKQDEIEKNLSEINIYMKNTKEPKEEIDLKCFNPYPCPFFNYCKGNIPDNNVFNIGYMPKKEMLKLYKEGKYSYEDLLTTDIKDKFRQQIEFELYNKEDYMDKDNIKEFLNTLTYPLYFLDFETYQMAIPEYDYSSPYQQIPFQYSLHYYKDENSKLEHKEFLAESKEGYDPRRKLAEQLVNDIPLNVCTLAYNMGFEKGVIKKLAEIYPDLADHLLNIHDNIKDLRTPFQKRYYYSKNMKGSDSIKKVLPSLFPNDPELDYHNLDLIHNGGEAMNSYRELKNKTEEEVKYIRERLLKYCCLDTYAMVKIYDFLKEKVNN